jgi:sugar lactone lactonase YvrE
MKIITILLFTIFSQVSLAQHKLEKIWETDTIVAVPESVLFQNSNTMYVSLIDGAPWDADGKGGVARMTAEGKNYEGSWITGLNAPKGLGIRGQQLYVADLSEVVVIDTKNSSIIKKIAIPGASGLNDLTVSENGTLYVSDSRTGKIWKIDNDMPEVFLDSVRGVNGLKAVGNELIVAAGRSFLKVDQQKKQTQIAELPQGGDGIEPVGNGDYIVTSWIGQVYYVYADGKVETMLDTSKEKINSADIGYDPLSRIVFVPTFNAKTVAAYRLK